MEHEQGKASAESVSAKGYGDFLCAVFDEWVRRDVGRVFVQIFDVALEQWLDIDAFATYLAMQDLIDNFDDIDGPGNNSYLFYDTATGEFTVVPWDHNLAFGLEPGPGDPAGVLLGGPSDGTPADRDLVPPPPGDTSEPAGDELEPLRPAGGGRPPNGPGDRGPGGGSNVLVERFLANAAWAALVDSRIAELQVELYNSGVAEEILDMWSQVVAASGLVDATTIESEAAQIRALLAS